MITSKSADDVVRKESQHIVDVLNSHETRVEQLAREFDSSISEHDAELDKALDIAFTERRTGIRWLLAPSVALAAKPIELLAGGQREQVIEELGRIASGDFS